MSDRPRFTGPPARWRWRPLAILALVLGVAMILAPRLAAQNTPDPAPAPGAAAPMLSAGATPDHADHAEADSGGGIRMGHMPTVLDLFKTNPWINGAILTLSVLAVLLFVFLMLTLTRSAFSPQRFGSDLTRLILSRQFDQAIHLCQNHPHVFTSSIVQRVIENREKDLAVLMEIIATEGRRRAEPVWSRVGYLAEISNLAPLFGLLGTVTGMITVFFTLNMRIATSNQTSQLATGIAEAMGATMFGLIVAIMSGIFYAFARSRAVGVLSESEQVCHTLADHVHRVVSEPTPMSAAMTVTAPTPARSTAPH